MRNAWGEECRGGGLLGEDCKGEECGDEGKGEEGLSLRLTSFPQVYRME